MVLCLCETLLSGNLLWQKCLLMFNQLLLSSIDYYILLNDHTLSVNWLNTFGRFCYLLFKRSKLLLFCSIVVRSVWFAFLWTSNVMFGNPCWTFLWPSSSSSILSFLVKCVYTVLSTQPYHWWIGIILLFNCAPE